LIQYLGLSVAGPGVFHDAIEADADSPKRLSALAADLLCDACQQSRRLLEVTNLLNPVQILLLRFLPVGFTGDETV